MNVTEPIIQSLLDTDLYKLTMMQVVFHQFASAKALYRLECRNAKPTGYLKEEVLDQIKALATLQFKPSELDYLSKLPYFKADFLEYLERFSFNPSQVWVSQQVNELSVLIEGPWLETILYEVPLLAIISELYGQSQSTPGQLEQGRMRLNQKIHDLQAFEHEGFGFTDFGTRRRYSQAWHEEVVQTFKLQVPHPMKGTSNVLLAMELDLPIVGTMAHEYVQACQVLAPDVLWSQRFALETWAQEYQPDLLIALTDTLGFDVFIREFSYELANLYQGLRQDSGDPLLWTQQALAMYAQFGLSAQDKTFVYSDRLTFPKAHEIYQRFKEVCRPTFGIGTYLTNDVGLEPLDIVIKLNRLNDMPVVKISDSPGKEVCDDQEYLINFKNKLGLV